MSTQPTRRTMRDAVVLVAIEDQSEQAEACREAEK
jgi:hypothetical protein